MGDCAEVSGHVLVYVAPLMAQARALGKTLAGEPTEVSYPAMPVTIKTPACPVTVAPPAAGAQGEWSFEVDGPNVKGEFRDGAFHEFPRPERRLRCAIGLVGSGNSMSGLYALPVPHRRLHP